MPRRRAATTKTKRGRTQNNNNNHGDGNKQVERVVRAIEVLASGPKEPEELALALGISERTLRRFMTRLERAGVPVYMRRAPSERHKMLWTMDVEKYLERFRK